MNDILKNITYEDLDNPNNGITADMLFGDESGKIEPQEVSIDPLRSLLEPNLPPPRDLKSLLDKSPLDEFLSAHSVGLAFSAEMYEAGKNYIKEGLSIIPVGKDKRPLIKWLEFQERKATEDELKTWLQTFADMQLGCVTGKISNLIIVDIDKPDLDLSWLPTTAIVKTGSGGMHYYYSFVEGFTNRARIKEFIDIRANGGYVVLPPSSNLKGKYEWVKKVKPVSFPINLFQQEQEIVTKEQVKTEYTGFGEGQRNQEMVKYVGHVIAKIHPSEWESIAFPVIQEANTANRPPLNDFELRTIFDSICSRERRSNTDRWYNREVEPVKKTNFVDNLAVKDDYKLRYTWGTRSLDTTFSIIKRGNFIVLGAKSGCLHPNTPIFDPIDKTTFTVKERFNIGKSFNVFALNEKREIIITKADAPVEFCRNEMVSLTNGKETIIVTPHHRVWDGENYTKVCELPKSSGVLLPSISDAFLLNYFSNGQNFFDKVVNFRYGYRFLYRLCGRLLRSVKEIVQDVFPSLIYVREHNLYVLRGEGVWGNKQGYSQTCQPSCHSSTPDYLSPEYNNHGPLFLFRLKLNIFLRHALKLPLFSGLHTFFCQTYKVLYTVLSVPSSMVYNTAQDFLHRFAYNFKVNNKQFHYTKWEIKVQEDEVYYDFTVPKYENYYACGLFHHNSGKTTFAFDMAMKNALLGHKILFLSLEMDETEVKNAVARKKSGMTIEEELDYNIPENKQLIFENKVAEINSIKNLFFEGVRRGGGLKWEEILDIIYKYNDLDMVIIDNLDLIEGERGENDLDRQKRVVKKIMGFTSEKRVPIVLIHHYRKIMGKEGKVANIDDLSGSKKICDGADRVLNISHNNKLDAEYPAKYQSIIYLQKGREYDDAIGKVYFIRGTFVDEKDVPTFEDYYGEPDPRDRKIFGVDD